METFNVRKASFIQSKHLANEHRLVSLDHRCTAERRTTVEDSPRNARIFFARLQGRRGCIRCQQIPKTFRVAEHITFLPARVLCCTLSPRDCVDPVAPGDTWRVSHDVNRMRNVTLMVVSCQASKTAVEAIVFQLGGV